MGSGGAGEPNSVTARGVLHYFYGDDTFAARSALEKLATEKHASFSWLDQENLAQRSLSEWLGWGSGTLFGAQIFVLRDASQFPKGLQEDILACTQSELHTDCVIWDRSLPNKSSLIFQRLKNSSRRFSLPSREHTREWLTHEAQKRGGRLEGAAAQLLIERAGVDKWRLTSELDKLLLSSDVITAPMVTAAVPPAAEAEIFSMLEALVGGSRRQALKSIEVLLNEGHSEFYILAMFMYQFRTLLVVRAGLDSGKRVHDIVREGKLKQFAVQKNLPYARRFSQSFLLTTLTKVLATEFAIKQGKVDSTTGLMMFVLGLVSPGPVRVSA